MRLKANGTNWRFFQKSNAVDIELVRGIAISNISIERITQTANAKTEFVPLRRSFRLVKYGQWFVDQIDFTYARYMGSYEPIAATSCRRVRRYSLNRHPCTSVGQTIIDTGAISVYLRAARGFGQVPIYMLHGGICGELCTRNWEKVVKIDPTIEINR